MRVLRTLPRSVRDVLEFAAAEALEYGVFLGDEMDEAAVEDEDVEQAVVVEVVDAGAPTDVLGVGLGDAVARAEIFKGDGGFRGFAFVAEEAVVVRIGDEHVEGAAAFEVGDDGAHCASVFPVLAVGCAGFVGDFLKGAVVLVIAYWKFYNVEFG